MAFPDCNRQTGLSTKQVTHVTPLGAPETSEVGGCLSKSRTFALKGEEKSGKVDYDIIVTLFITKGWEALGFKRR